MQRAGNWRNTSTSICPDARNPRSHGLRSFSSQGSEPGLSQENSVSAYGRFHLGAQRVDDQHGWISMGIRGANTLFSQGLDF